MIKPKELFDLFKIKNLTFYTGVPDSLLKDLCAYITDNTESKNNIIAANEGNFDKKKIFEIYLSIPFNINQLINANTVYQGLTGYEARALIYQKILLSDNLENRINLLFLLKEIVTTITISTNLSFWLAYLFIFFIPLIIGLYQTINIEIK